MGIVYSTCGDIYSNCSNMCNTHRSTVKCIKDYDKYKYKCNGDSSTLHGHQWLVQVTSIDYSDFRP